MTTTKLERTLIASLILVIILIPIIFLALFFIVVEEDHNPICISPECMRASIHILDNMDSTVNPCDDFYKFACGNYIKSQVIPEDKSEINSFTEIRDMVHNRLRILLEEPIKRTDIRPFRFAKQHYKTCMNTNQDNSETLKYRLRQLGGWPVLEGDNWNSRKFDWRQLAINLQLNGFESKAFIVLTAEVMLNNSSQRIIEIDEPKIVYSEYLKNMQDNITLAYFDLMVDIVEELGAPRSRAVTEMSKVLNLINHLANLSVPADEKKASQKLLNLMTVTDLELIFPIVEWSYFINKQLLGVASVTENTTVNVLFPKHLKRLNSLIIRFDERTIANYMFWSAIFNQIEYINENLKLKLANFLKLTDGSTENIPQWQECVLDISQRLPLVSSSMYVRKYFQKEAKESMEYLVRDILKQFKIEIENLEWMDDESKSRALKKADAIKTFIGYPYELLDDKAMSEYFKDLGDASDNFLLLSLKLANFTTKSYFRFLNEPVNKTDWRKQHSPIDVNAFYDVSFNSMHFPAGILQENIFGYKKPNFVNYGGIGFLIGHEITHGFDDEGRLFDEDGNLVDWWEKSTRKLFQENALCIIEQYDNITVPELGIKLNGLNTQGENIADNGGIKHAYMAYKNWLNNHGPDKLLPEFLNYTSEQMFWISSASSWCSKTRPLQLKHMLVSDVHVPMYYRINVAFANSEYFAKDFNCPIGSNMNPYIKCKVW